MVDIHQAQRPPRIVPAVPRVFEKKIKSATSRALNPPARSVVDLDQSTAQSGHQQEERQASPEPEVERSGGRTDPKVGVTSDGRHNDRQGSTTSPKSHSSTLLASPTPNALPAANEESLTEPTGSSSALVSKNDDLESDSVLAAPSPTASVSSQPKADRHIHADPVFISHHPIVYPIQPPPFTFPSQPTPPEDALSSSVQTSFQGYAPYPLFQPQPTPPTDLTPVSAHTTYYGYGHAHNLSFYPQSNRSYGSNSPTQSSYEGYAVACSPRPVQSYNQSLWQHSPSLPDQDNDRQSNVGGSLKEYHDQSQTSLPYSAVPHFGNSFPFTPSATPSNNGSQHHNTLPAPPNDERVEEKSLLECRSGSGETTTSIAEYGVRCQRIVDTLLDGVEETEYQSQLCHYLREQFSASDYVDVHLCIRHHNKLFEPKIFSLHSLLLAQNEKLRLLLQRADLQENGTRQVSLDVEDQYATPASIESALQVYYGTSFFLYTAVPQDYNAIDNPRTYSAAWMDNALSYAAAGHFLGMTGVAHRGEQIASAILNRDNLEKALIYTLDESLDRCWVDSRVSRMNLDDFPSNANGLLLSCLYYIITSILNPFHFDVSARPLPFTRLPDAAESRDTCPPKASLHRIQFGDLHTETATRISEKDCLISSSLLSLPFALLKFIIDRLPVDMNRQITEQVINERERRKRKANPGESIAGRQKSDSVDGAELCERVIQARDETSRLGIERS